LDTAETVGEPRTVGRRFWSGTAHAAQRHLEPATGAKVRGAGRSAFAW
jgi:hypothetical protein